VFRSVGDYSVSFTQLAPAFSVIFISLILKDKIILYEIKSRLCLQRINIKWSILSIFIPVVCIVVSGLLMSLFKITYISWTGSVLFYILNIVAMLVGCFAEEIGWRGFLLPRLQEKHSPFVSSIIVGFLWGIWHLNFTGGILGFILYTISIIEMSVLMTWLFNKTNLNLTLMIVWHFMYNLSSHIFLWERFNIYLFIVQSIIFGIISTVVVITNKKEFFNKTLSIKST